MACTVRAARPWYLEMTWRIRTWRVSSPRRVTVACAVCASCSSVVSRDDVAHHDLRVSSPRRVTVACAVCTSCSSVVSRGGSHASAAADCWKAFDGKSTAASYWRSEDVGRWRAVLSTPVWLEVSRDDVAHTDLVS